MHRRHMEERPKMCEREHICAMKESTNRSPYLSVPLQCNAGGTDKWDNAVSYE